MLQKYIPPDQPALWYQRSVDIHQIWKFLTIFVFYASILQGILCGATHFRQFEVQTTQHYFVIITFPFKQCIRTMFCQYEISKHTITFNEAIPG